jgi:hypothetical protein
MKTVISKKIFVLLLPGIFSFLLMNAQIASWSFNNILTGAGTANSIAGNRSLKSRIYILPGENENQKISTKIMVL